MRILVLTQYFWPENFIINDMVKGLKEKGHDVEVLTGKPNYPEGKLYKGYSLFGTKQETHDGIVVNRVPLIPRGRSKGWNLILNYLSFAFFASMYTVFFTKNKYDRIFVFQPSPITAVIPGLIARFLYKIPVVLLIQDLWPESLSASGAIKSKTVLRLVDKLVCYLLGKVDTVLVQSMAFIPKLKMKGVSESKLFYFPDYADDVFTNALTDKGKDIYVSFPKGFKILFAGNIGESQDFSTILNAAEMIKSHENIQWIILGEGRKKTWVEEEVIKRGLQNTVHLLGKFPLNYMPYFFSLADVMLVTLKDEEIFSLTIPGKIQPYMASAKPILAALNGEGRRIILESKSGYVSSSGDYEGLARAAIALNKLTKYELDAMGEQGKQYYDKYFSRGMLLDKLENLIRK